MPRHSYPLVRYVFDDGSEEESAIHPCVPVRITNPVSKLSERLYALVDTGADKCLFPANLTEDLGHDLKGDGVRGSVNVGIEQREVSVHLHTFKIELLAPDEKTVVWSSGDLEIDCSESNPPVILGACDFLKHFKWTVDYPNGTLSAEW